MTPGDTWVLQFIAGMAVLALACLVAVWVLERRQR